VTEVESISSAKGQGEVKVTLKCKEVQRRGKEVETNKRKRAKVRLFVMPFEAPFVTLMMKSNECKKAHEGQTCVRRLRPQRHRRHLRCAIAKMLLISCPKASDEL
jgi:hypothetical protein